jgi:2-polyprenyl-3-methyl-5-hydroxy-6-metoxy-1,4-benzoquinol methylase
MSQPRFDQDFWEQLWSKTLREQAEKVARRPPNAHLMAEAANLPPGRALDGGCGHGADTLWLAAHGWRVTAVDFSAAALAHGRSMAEAAGHDIAARINWIESDFATWTAEPDHYDPRAAPDVPLCFEGRPRLDPTIRRKRRRGSLVASRGHGW